jgi:hypothetical protein
MIWGGLTPVEARVIDHFDVLQRITASTRRPLSAITGSDQGVLGGERDLRVRVNDGPSDAFFGVNIFGDGVLEYAASAAVGASAEVHWDGVDFDPRNFNPTGLGGIDFLENLADAFIIDVLVSDHPALIGVTVFDADDPSGNTWSRGTAPVVRSPRLPQQIVIPYASMQQVGPGGAADMSNVGAVIMFIENRDVISLDITVDSIETRTIPEPSTAILLGGVLALLAARIALRKRR